MKRAVFAFLVAAAATSIDVAGSLQVKSLGPPVPLPPAAAAAVPTARQQAPLERIRDLREGPTIDVATGQIIASGGSRSNTVIYNNTTNGIACFAPAAATTQCGDAIFMTNGGRLQRVKLSIVNGDTVSVLLTAQIKVVFYDGATPTPNLLASFTTPTIDFGLIVPGGISPGYGCLQTLDVSLLDPPIILPQFVHVGYILENITGTPAAPTSIGQVLYSPPTIGVSQDSIWSYTLDGAGVFYKDWTFGGDPVANFYYELEVDPVTLIPPPSYDNTTNALGGVISTVPDDGLFDDLYPIASPPGQFLDRLDFSIYNGDTATTLTSTDLDIVLRAWNPDSSAYYPESDPVHNVTFAFANVLVNLPPGYAGFFYVDQLAQLGVTVPSTLLAGIRFRNTNPDTVRALGQALYYPPTVGATDGVIHINDWPPYVIPGAFYWRLSTPTPLPCTRPGDMNCDGSINNIDIDGFVYALFGLADRYDFYLRSMPIYNPCDMRCGDFTGDRAVNSQDIDGFVAALFGS